MELLYLILVAAVLFEIVVFLLLNLPTPTGVKGKVAKFLENNRRSQIFVLVFFVILLIAGVLWFDCNRMEGKYRAERQLLQEQTNPGTGIAIS